MQAKRQIDFGAARAVPILDVAYELGIKVKGRKAMCFSGHDAKTPSLSFWVEKNSWKCFGCSLSGSPIDLVCYVLGFSNPLDGAKWIDHKFGLGSSASLRSKKSVFGGHASMPSADRPSNHKSELRNLPDAEVYEWLVERCRLSDNGYRYLHEERNLSRSTIERFRVCELRDPKRAFAALVKRWEINRLEKCGLCGKNRFAKNAADENCLIWFRRCLLFPFVNNGKVEYIQARMFADRAPKYIGLSGVEKPMFNIDELKRAPKKSDIYICEGVTDTLAAHELGLRAIGVLGASSFRNEWVSLFEGLYPMVVPDNDSAGNSFRKSVQRAFAVHGRVVNSVSIGRHNDLSDVVSEKSSPQKTGRS